MSYESTEKFPSVWNVWVAICVGRCKTLARWAQAAALRVSPYGIPRYLFLTRNCGFPRGIIQQRPHEGADSLLTKLSGKVELPRGNHFGHSSSCPMPDGVRSTKYQSCLVRCLDRSTETPARLACIRLIAGVTCLKPRLDSISIAQCKPA